MKYTHIGYSLFSTLKQTFVTGSSRLINLQKQVTNQYFVLIYYLSFIYLLSYIYLNIFYGLMMSMEEQKALEENSKETSFELKISRNSLKKETMKLSANRGRRSSKANGEIKPKDFSGKGHKASGFNVNGEDKSLENSPRLIKQTSSSMSKNSSILKQSKRS